MKALAWPAQPLSIGTQYREGFGAHTAYAGSFNLRKLGEASLTASR